MMTTMNNEDPADPSGHEPRGRDWPEPVAWVRDLAAPQPHCVTSLRYRSKSDADAGTWYAPLYTADQMREAIATERERRCPGIPDPHCNYLATCCTICNKCGRQHAGSIPPTWVTRPTRSEALAAAGFTRRPSLKAMEMRAALELIAAPMRPDGTWNRDREACRELAAEALGRYDDNETPNVRGNRPDTAAQEQEDGYRFDGRGWSG